MVILRCLTGLNLDWFKSYGLRCSLRLHASSVNFKKRQLINIHFKTMYGHFFANYMFIFHKTKIQTVILRCLRIINLNFYKSYDTKHKNAKNPKNANAGFVQNCKIKRNGNICVLCQNFWSNQNVDLLSTSKWPSEPQFCEIWTYIWQKMVRNGRTKAIYKGTFISIQTLFFN